MKIANSDARYVGSTNNVTRRFNEHLTESTTLSHLKKSQWINTIGKHDVKVCTVYTVDTSGILTEDKRNRKVLEKEQEYIDKFLKAGADLTNEKLKLLG